MTPRATTAGQPAQATGPATTLAGPVAHVLLNDGSVALVRPLQPTDVDELMALYDRADTHTLRMRFFTSSRAAAVDYVRHLFAGTAGTVLTLVAEVRGRIVGEATAALVASDTAEVAFLVDGSTRGHGVGSLLLEHLAAGCAERGIRRFDAEVLPENDAMLGVFRDAGFTTALRLDDGVAKFEISTTATPSALRAADERDTRAETQSLRRLLRPRSVAVVGARRDGSGIGHAVLTSILAGGFSGDVHVVHPESDSIAGVRAYPSFSAIPDDVDLAVIAVPATAAASALRDAAQADVGGAVVISSGFGELGPRAEGSQEELVEIARAHDLRLVGPNCLGIICNSPGVRLNAVFSGSTPNAGGLAVASQSGGFGVSLLDVATELGVGVQSFVSLGNKADVSGNDLLAAWYADPEVTAAALYLESFGNTPTFARLARRFAERKPLLAVVGGRSSSGRRAGESHTAAAAANRVGVDALFAQAGVISCRSARTVATTALVLQEQPLPLGRRIAIVSNAGGIGVVAADAAEDLGIVVPALSAELRTALALGPAGMTGTSNPVDLGADADGARVAAAIGTLAGSPEVDAVVLGLVGTRVVDPLPTADALRTVREAHPDVPIVLVPLGGLTVPSAMRGTVSVLDTPEEAVEALAGAARYAEWRRTSRTEEPEVRAHATDRGSLTDDTADAAAGDRADTARQLARDLLDRNPGGTWLDPHETRALLEPYGLAPTGELCGSMADALAAARRSPRPVVVKVADREVVHRSDRGLVRVGLRSDVEVQEALWAFEAELGRSGVPVLVQPVSTGVELAMGMQRDPVFGPLLMVAAGGVASELLDDRAHLLPPVHRRDAARALRSLRVWPLLEGYRGRPASDVARLEDLLVDLARLVADVPEIAEIDLNPVMASADGADLVDVKVRLAPGAEPVLARQLRRG